jgi:hypothetical protein
MHSAEKSSRYGYFTLFLPDAKSGIYTVKRLRRGLFLCG